MNVLHLQYVGCISYGLAVAGGWKAEKLGKLFHVLGDCCRSACNFVRLGTLLQLSSSNRFLFMYSRIYAARILQVVILSA
jgi:hypothetical protein